MFKNFVLPEQDVPISGVWHLDRPEELYVLTNSYVQSAATEPLLMTIRGLVLRQLAVAVRLHEELVSKSPKTRQRGYQLESAPDGCTCIQIRREDANIIGTEPVTPVLTVHVLPGIAVADLVTDLGAQQLLTAFDQIDLRRGKHRRAGIRAALARAGAPDGSHAISLPTLFERPVTAAAARLVRSWDQLAQQPTYLCPSNEVLQRFHRNELGADQTMQRQAHLVFCQYCLSRPI